LVFFHKTELDPTKTVKDIVEEGVQEIVNLVKRYEAVNLQLSELGC